MVAELKELSPLEKELVLKMRSLSKEKVAEVQNFIDFLKERLEEDRLTEAAMQLSEETLQETWNDDSDYGTL